VTGEQLSRLLVRIDVRDPARYAWEPVAPGDPDHLDHPQRMLHVVADRIRWLETLAEARRRAAGGQDPADASATAA
jgi:hypothetical protein